MGTYKVLGKRPFRDHPPGTIFRANIHPEQVRRAVARGILVVIDASPVRLESRQIRRPERE
jgi:hypothetical protein